MFHYIAENSSPDIATRYTDSLIEYCESFQTLPHRGTKRDDILPGLRTVGDRNRVLIAFKVDSYEVMMIGIFYGGQDFESLLSNVDRDE